MAPPSGGAVFMPEIFHDTARGRSLQIFWVQGYGRSGILCKLVPTDKEKLGAGGIDIPTFFKI